MLSIWLLLTYGIFGVVLIYCDESTVDGSRDRYIQSIAVSCKTIIGSVNFFIRRAYYCYSIAWDIIKSLVLLPVCLSVRAPICRSFYSILMNFCIEVRGPKSKNAFVRGQNPMTLPYSVPIFHPVMHFQR